MLFRSFVHPVSGEEMRFSSPLPDDLVRLVKRLRGLAAGARGGEGARDAGRGGATP